MENTQTNSATIPNQPAESGPAVPVTQTPTSEPSALSAPESPPVPTPPAEDAPAPVTPDPAPKVDVQAALAQSGSGAAIPRINLLATHPEEPETAAAPPPPASPAAIEAPARTPAAAPASVAHRSRKPLIAVAVLAVLLAGGAGAYVWVINKPAAKPLATNSPPATPAPTPTPPPPAPPPAGGPAPAPDSSSGAAVSAPAATPTSAAPQTVTVNAPGGIWLRSTPDSSSRANIIGWIPHGGQVSVDQASGFWWHGTYKGVSGYFASRYTN